MSQGRQQRLGGPDGAKLSEQTCKSVIIDTGGHHIDTAGKTVGKFCFYCS